LLIDVLKTPQTMLFTPKINYYREIFVQTLAATACQKDTEMFYGDTWAQIHQGIAAH